MKVQKYYLCGCSAYLHSAIFAFVSFYLFESAFNRMLQQQTVYSLCLWLLLGPTSFRSYFFNSSSIYKRLGQFDYGQLNNETKIWDGTGIRIWPDGHTPVCTKNNCITQWCWINGRLDWTGRATVNPVLKDAAICILLCIILVQLSCHLLIFNNSILIYKCWTSTAHLLLIWYLCLQFGYFICKTYNYESKVT